MKRISLAAVLFIVLSGVCMADNKPYSLYAEYIITTVEIPQVVNGTIMSINSGPTLILNLYLENNQTVPLILNDAIHFEANSPVEFGNISPIGSSTRTPLGNVTFDVDARNTYPPLGKTLVMQMLVPIISNNSTPIKPVAALGDSNGLSVYGAGVGSGNFVFGEQYFMGFNLHSARNVIDASSLEAITIPDNGTISNLVNSAGTLTWNNGKWEKSY